MPAGLTSQHARELLDLKDGFPQLMSEVLRRLPIQERCAFRSSSTLLLQLSDAAAHRLDLKHLQMPITEDLGTRFPMVKHLAFSICNSSGSEQHQHTSGCIEALETLTKTCPLFLRRLESLKVGIHHFLQPAASKLAALVRECTNLKAFTLSQEAVVGSCLQFEIAGDTAALVGNLVTCLPHGNTVLELLQQPMTGTTIPHLSVTYPEDFVAEHETASPMISEVLKIATIQSLTISTHDPAVIHAITQTRHPALAHHLRALSISIGGPAAASDSTSWRSLNQLSNLTTLTISIAPATDPPPEFYIPDAWAHLPLQSLHLNTPPLANTPAILRMSALHNLSITSPTPFLPPLLKALPHLHSLSFTSDDPDPSTPPPASDNTSLAPGGPSLLPSHCSLTTHTSGPIQPSADAERSTHQHPPSHPPRKLVRLLSRLLPSCIQPPVPAQTPRHASTTSHTPCHGSPFAAPCAAAASPPLTALSLYNAHPLSLPHVLATLHPATTLAALHIQLAPQPGPDGTGGPLHSLPTASLPLPPSLRSLTLQHAQVPLFPLLSACTTLHHLHLQECVLHPLQPPASPPTLPHLRTLRLTSCSEPNPGITNPAARRNLLDTLCRSLRAPRLTALHRLASPGLITTLASPAATCLGPCRSSSLQQLLASCPQLLPSAIRGFSVIFTQPEHLLAIARTHPTFLTDNSFRDTFGLTPSCLPQALALASPHLHTLNLLRVYSPRTLQAALTTCGPHLTSLTLLAAYIPATVLITLLSSCAQLRTLCLANMPPVSASRVLAAVASSCPLLQHLHLRRCSAKPAAFLHLEGLQSLQQLVLDDVTMRHAPAVVHVLASQHRPPRLRYLGFRADIDRKVGPRPMGWPIWPELTWWQVAATVYGVRVVAYKEWAVKLSAKYVGRSVVFEL